MKRFLSILLVAVLVVSSFATVAFAANGSANANVSKSQTVKAGDTVTLTVTVSGEFSNYELKMTADSGLTITAITGVTANASNGKVAYSSGVNVNESVFTVTVKVADDIKPGSYKVTATPTYGSMIVPVEQDTEDGVVDGRVRVSLGADSATLTINCEHNYQLVEDVAPTCTEDGYKKYKCSVCGDSYTEKVAALGHAWDDGVVTTQPTCTEKGVKTFTCTKCGETKTESVAALGHSWDNGVVTTEATCLVEGVKTYTCTVCGETKTESIGFGAHKWGEWKVVKAATCTEDGLKERVCSVCGEKQTEVIPAAEGHKWGEWTETKAPTCTEAGEMTRKCSACDAVETKAVDALGHKFDHSTWKYDEANHWHVCTVCGAKCEHDGAHVEANGYIVVKEPTAKETGLEVLYCEICGYEMDSREIPANGEGPIDPVPGTGDPTMLIGGLSFLLLVLLAAALYVFKRKAAAK